MPDNHLTELTGKVNLLGAFPHALQHVLAMFASNLVPIMTIAAVGRNSLPNELVLVLVQNALFVAGIATLIQATPIWKIGSGLPIVMGISFTFLIALSSISLRYGYGAVVGAVIAGGVFEGLLGLSARYWKKIITPIVAVIIFVMSLILDLVLPKDLE